MKVALLARNLLSNFSSHSHSHCPLRKNISGLPYFYYLYSTQIQTLKRNNPREEFQSLYKRISPLGDIYLSVVPVLDQWIQEGRSVNQRDLQRIIKELRHYRRFKHALEISQWMTDKRYMSLSAADAAIRLDLIGKVHGIEQAEIFFNNIPQQLKTVEVYGALLSCYSQQKCLDKAEALMQQMRGFHMSTLNYNNVLSLYFQTGNREKVDILMHEMEERGIKSDRFTYAILVNGYGDDCDIDEMEKVLSQMESDLEVDIGWDIYAGAAHRYLRAGLVDKALKSLRKSEKVAAFAYRKNEASPCILTVYAAAGKQEDVLRVWKKCQYMLTNMSYKSMLPSILKFDDIETAEKIFMEWEGSDLSKDIRIPNFLIATYCRKGFMDKAEALVEKVNVNKWQKPNLFTWSSMAVGYVHSNQMPKAVKALKSAILERHPRGRWKPDKETLMACLKHSKEEGDTAQSGEFGRLLHDYGIISAEIYARLLEYFSGEYAGEDALEGYDLGVDGESVEAQLIKDSVIR